MADKAQRLNVPFGGRREVDFLYNTFTSFYIQKSYEDFATILIFIEKRSP